MNAERRVKLFNNGGNRAIRIPEDFEFDGDEATIRKDGDRLIVEPVRKGSPCHLPNRSIGSTRC